MNNFIVTLIEDKIHWGDKEANIIQLKENMNKVPVETDLVVLPELFTTGFIVNDKEKIEQLAERNTQETIRTIQDLAKKYNKAFMGSFLAHTAGKYFNRGFFIEPNGDEIFYDKRHLFSMGGENENFHAGIKSSPIIRFRGWDIKIVICYDLRFPIWCRNTTKDSYDILVVVANWPKARQSAWQSLLIARAIENECYVCGINRSGTDAGGIDYSEGSSIVVDYKGNIIAQRNYNQSNSQIISSILSLEDLKKFKKKFPVLEDADEFSIK